MRTDSLRLVPVVRIMLNQNAMCNAVDELFSRTIPDRVWHYTSLSALEGILTSNRVWATDCRFTNDTTEFVHMRDVADGCIQSLQSSGSMGSFPSLDLHGMLHLAFDRGPLSSAENEVCIISFSEACDALTQWNQYADGARGVSIAFDLQNVRPPAEARIGVTFAPCVYDQNGKEQLVKSVFERFTDAVAMLDEQSKNPAWLEGQLRTWRLIDDIFGRGFDRSAFTAANTQKFTDKLRSAWRLTVFDLLRVASHCKHDAFFAEREWRLAMPRPKSRPSTEHPVQYRGMNNDIPYFESDLFCVNKLPIVEIKAGPLCTELERIQAAIEQNGYECPVTRSGIPLRH